MLSIVCCTTTACVQRTVTHEACGKAALSSSTAHASLLVGCSTYIACPGGDGGH